MKPEIKELIEKQIMFATAKADAIISKYELYDSTDDVNVKDLEDIRRYSEIVRNLSTYLSQDNAW